MKLFTLLAASLALPMAIGSAQAQTTTNGTFPYVPLFGSSASGTSTSANSSAWFIDTARNNVVLCTQTGGGTAGGALSISCTAQSIPTASTGSSGGSGTGGASGAGGGSGASGGAGASGGGSTGSSGGGGASGGAMANPLGK